MDNLKATDTSVATRHLVRRWQEIAKPGTHRQSSDRWQNYTGTWETQ